MLSICVSPVFALMLLCYCYEMMGGDLSDGGGKCALTKNVRDIERASGGGKLVQRLFS